VIFTNFQIAGSAQDFTGGAVSPFSKGMILSSGVGAQQVFPLGLPI
jgi:hypothetical protein